MVYFIWLSIRARSLCFFSASNPGIPMGGMFGESKFELMEKIPSALRPKTSFVQVPATVDEVLAMMNRQGFNFPVIFKPDIGERGYLVRRIDNQNDIARYLQEVRIGFLVQDLIDLPLEFGVQYRRYPSRKEGEVVSIIAKEMLAVEGDGKSTLKQLILGKDRAKLQWATLKEKFEQRLDEVIPPGERVELVSIGNHAKGTKFLDGSKFINDRLSGVFDKISQAIPGFYFGRFDLRCASLDDLYEGRVVILELNGCGAEPAHVYDPSFGLFRAMAVQVRHWKDIFTIARENRSRGVGYISFKEALQYYRKFKSATS